MPYAKSARSYLALIKDWKIRNMVAGYVESRLVFKGFDLEGLKPKRLIPFEELLHLCDILYNVKEDHHLVFRRPEEKREISGSEKFQPNAAERDFLNNVGLLFHKVMVARELRYVIERYPANATAQQASYDSLKEHLEKIDRLFDEGVDCTINLIQAYGENAVLITYLVEDASRVGRALQLRCEDLLVKMTGKPTPEKAYMMAARYYIESGWYEKASDMLKRALKQNPANVEAKKLLDRFAEGV